MQPANATGFTLIELVTTLLLLSIIGVVAFARLGSFGNIEPRAFYQDTVTALQYAQKLAVGTGCNVQARLTSSQYSLTQRDTDCSTGGYNLNVVTPANRAAIYSANAPAGANISIVGPTTLALPLTMRFRPDYGIDGLGSESAPSFSVAGRQFTLYAQTGLVDAQ